MKAYMLLAPGFEESEAIVPLDILRRAGIDVLTVGIGSQTVESSHGVTVEADLDEDDVLLEDADMLILPGGMPGTVNLERLVHFCFHSGNWYLLFSIGIRKTV